MKGLLIAIINNNVVVKKMRFMCGYRIKIMVVKNDLRFIVFICVPLQ